MTKSVRDMNQWWSKEICQCLHEILEPGNVNRITRKISYLCRLKKPFNKKIHTKHQYLFIHFKKNLTTHRRLI